MSKTTVYQPLSAAAFDFDTKSLVIEKRDLVAKMQQLFGVTGSTQIAVACMTTKMYSQNVIHYTAADGKTEQVMSDWLDSYLRENGINSRMIGSKYGPNFCASTGFLDKLYTYSNLFKTIVAIDTIKVDVDEMRTLSKKDEEKLTSIEKTRLETLVEQLREMGKCCVHGMIDPDLVDLSTMYSLYVKMSNAGVNTNLLKYWAYKSVRATIPWIKKNGKQPGSDVMDTALYSDKLITSAMVGRRAYYMENDKGKALKDENVEEWLDNVKDDYEKDDYKTEREQAKISRPKGADKVEGAKRRKALSEKPNVLKLGSSTESVAVAKSSSPASSSKLKLKLF